MAHHTKSAAAFVLLAFALPFALAYEVKKGPGGARLNGCSKGYCFTSCWDPRKWCWSARPGEVKERVQCSKDEDCDYEWWCVTGGECIEKTGVGLGERIRSLMLGGATEYGCFGGRCWTTCWDPVYYCDAYNPFDTVSGAKGIGKSCKTDADCKYWYSCAGACGRKLLTESVLGPVSKGGKDGQATAPPDDSHPGDDPVSPKRDDDAAADSGNEKAEL